MRWTVSQRFVTTLLYKTDTATYNFCPQQFYPRGFIQNTLPHMLWFMVKALWSVGDCIFGRAFALPLSRFAALILMVIASIAGQTHT